MQCESISHVTVSDTEILSLCEMICPKCMGHRSESEFRDWELVEGRTDDERTRKAGCFLVCESCAVAVFFCLNCGTECIRGALFWKYDEE